MFKPPKRDIIDILGGLSEFSIIIVLPKSKWALVT